MIRSDIKRSHPPAAYSRSGTGTGTGPAAALVRPRARPRPRCAVALSVARASTAILDSIHCSIAWLYAAKCFVTSTFSTSCSHRSPTQAPAECTPAPPDRLRVVVCPVYGSDIAPRAANLHAHTPPCTYSLHRLSVLRRAMLPGRYHGADATAPTCNVQDATSKLGRTKLRYTYRRRSEDAALRPGPRSQCPRGGGHCMGATLISLRHRHPGELGRAAPVAIAD